MKELINRFRHWLIIKLIGDSQYAVNLTINGTVEIESENEKCYIYNCSIKNVMTTDEFIKHVSRNTKLLIRNGEN